MTLWPSYLPRKESITLTPSVLTGDSASGLSIITKEGGEHHSFAVSGWDSCKSLLLEKDLLLFTTHLTEETTFPWLDQIRKDTQCKVFDGVGYKKIGIRGNDRRYRWIIPTGAWSDAPPGKPFLDSITAVFNHCGHVRPTPPSLGKLLMLEDWAIHNRLPDVRSLRDTNRPEGEIGNESTAHYKRHPLPPRACRIDIKRHLHGGRIQYFGRVLPGYCKVDRDNALVTSFTLHPTGYAARQFGSVVPKHSTTWFCRCSVTIRFPLGLGPFPVREPSLHWPTSVGTYSTWLWREQAEDAIAAGCDVTVQDGWRWQSMTDDNAAWAKHMISLRESAPTPEVRSAIKRIASSAISCLGIGDVRYEIVSELESTRDDIPLFDHHGRLRDSLRKSFTSSRPTPVHWYAYTWMQVARELYRQALPHAQANRLVGMLTDCFYLSETVDVPVGYKLEMV